MIVVEVDVDDLSCPVEKCERAKDHDGQHGPRPLRAVGVSRDLESPGERSVLVAFNRRPTDEELRDLHDRLAGR